MQGDIVEKEELYSRTPKIAVKNKRPEVTGTRTSSQRKTKYGIKGGEDNAIVVRSSVRQVPSLSRSVVKKQTGDHVMKKLSRFGDEVRDLRLTEKKETLGNTSSSKIKASSTTSKTKGSAGNKVVAVKESHSFIAIKKPSDKLASGPPKTRTNGLVKPVEVLPNEVTDKKDQKLKFKGGGSSDEPSSSLLSKISSLQKGVLRPSVKAVSKEGKGNLHKRENGSEESVNMKQKDLLKKDSGKKRSSSTRPPLKVSVKEKSDSRMKENLKNIMSEHVRKSKVSHSSSLKKQVECGPTSVSLSEKEMFSKEGSAKKGRERTRTWTISTNVEDNNVTQHSGDSYPSVSGYGKNSCELMVSSPLQSGSQHKRDGDGHSAAGSEETVGNSIGGLVKYNNEIKSSGREDSQLVLSDTSGSQEPNVSLKNDIESGANVCSGDISDEYNYEDDFEDYESDFEEYTDDDGSSKDSSNEVPSSEGSEEQSVNLCRGKDENMFQREVMVEGVGSGDAMTAVGASAVKEDEEDGERKMDSGLYDSWRKRRQEDDFTSSKLMRVEADEGFDEREEVVVDGKWEVVAEEVVIKPSSNVSCKVFYCKRDPIGKEVERRVYDRGRRLLQMITLDEISYSLFDLPPIPYEAYMRCRGHLNTKQVSTQTNEEACSEGIQTDSIPMVDAWTQKPPVMESSVKSSENFCSKLLDGDSWIRLGKFLESAGEVMAILLEEQRNGFDSVQADKRLRGSSLSKISIKLGHGGSTEPSWEYLLAARPVVSVCFCKTRSNLLLCCHGLLKDSLGCENYQGEQCAENYKEIEPVSSLLSIWSVNEPSHPYKILCCQGCVTRACFQEGINDSGQLVFAGTGDGSIYVWDIYERGNNNVKVPILKNHKENALCPMFTTYGDEVHLGKIVGLEPVFSSVFGDEDSEKQFSSRAKLANQICSLDEWGLVVVWSVIKRENKRGRDVGRVNLVASMKVCLGEADWNVPENSLDVNNHHVDEDRVPIGTDDIASWNSLAVDSDWILAASDTGSVVCLPLDGEQKSMRVYRSSKGSFASAECIAVNPQGLPFFMVGNIVGQVRLYSHSSTRSVGLWEPPSTAPPSSIIKLAWSPQRPFVFFTVDALSRMHIWDLASSDIFPFATLPQPKIGKITDISLSFPKGKSPSYMAVGIDTGQVILHELKDELTNKNHEISRKELSQFIKYANLL